MWLSIATDRPVERAVEQYNSFTRQLSSSFFYFFSVSVYIHSARLTFHVSSFTSDAEFVGVCAG